MPKFITFFTILFTASTLLADDPPRYIIKKEHDPDGIGKFYMDREIAHVMGYQAAGWLERPERKKEEEPAKLMKAMEIKPGMAIADVGAGSGYHTFRMAKLVGDKGTVYAVDIQPEMLKLIKAKMQSGNVSNVEPVKATEKDPNLKAKSIDRALMVDVYHEFNYPYEVTQKLVDALKPGGWLVFVEFRLEDDDVPIKRLHKMSERQVLKEMSAFKEMKHLRTVATLPWQHIVIFEKK